MMMEIQTFFRKVNKIDDQFATLINNQHLKMAECYEIRLNPKSGIDRTLLSAGADENQALLAYRNYVNISDSWMNVQAIWYRQLKDKYERLIELIE